MTRKHFEKLAEMLGKVEDRDTRAMLIAEVCNVGWEANPNFDAIRFADAVAKHHAENFGD